MSTIAAHPEYRQLLAHAAPIGRDPLLVQAAGGTVSLKHQDVLWVGGAALAQHFAADRIAELSARINPSRSSPLDHYPLPAPGERFPISDPALVPRDTPRPADEVPARSEETPVGAAMLALRSVA